MYHALLQPRRRGPSRPPSAARDASVARRLDPITAFDIHTQTVQELDVGTTTEVAVVTQIIWLPVTSIIVSSADASTTSNLPVSSISPPSFTSFAASSASSTAAPSLISTTSASLSQSSTQTVPFSSTHVTSSDLLVSTSPAASNPTPFGVVSAHSASSRTSRDGTFETTFTASTKQTSSHTTQSSSHPFATSDSSIATATPAPSHHLAPAIIGAIVASVVAVIIILALLIFFCLRRRRSKQRNDQEYTQAHNESPSPPQLPLSLSPGPVISVDPAPYAYWQRPSEPSPEPDRALEKEASPLKDSDIMPLKPQMAQLRHYIPGSFAPSALPQQHPQPCVLGTALLADPFSTPSSSSVRPVQAISRDYPQPLRQSMARSSRERPPPPLVSSPFLTQLSTNAETSYPPPLKRKPRLPTHVTLAEPPQAHMPTFQQPLLHPPPRNPRRMTSHTDVRSLLPSDRTVTAVADAEISPDQSHLPHETTKPHPSTWIWRTHARSSISSVSSTEFEFDGDDDDDDDDDDDNPTLPPAENSRHLHPDIVHSPPGRTSTNGSAAESAWTGEASGRRRSDPFEFDS